MTLALPEVALPLPPPGVHDLPPIVHVVGSLAREHGGPSYSVPSLAEALARGGASVSVRSVGDPAAGAIPAARGAAYRSYPVAGNPLGSAVRASPDLARALRADAAAGAILHAHGLWLMPNVYPARACQAASGRSVIVHAPRGMLSPAALEISAWKKRPFWWLLQRRALAAADCLHATAASEADEIRAAGLANPIAIIRNGVDVPPRLSGPDRSNGCTLLYLGRIHPKKGLDRLVAAWARLEGRYPDWSLRIVGTDERNHAAALRAQAGALGAARVIIEGPVYGAARDAAYHQADVVVLPSLNENFGMTVAESLAAGTPVVCTTGAPWSGLNAGRCGWWVEQGVEPLAAALAAAFEMPGDERRAMGERGRAWMIRDFSWDAVAAEMADVYRWLRFGGEPPATVRFA